MIPISLHTQNKEAVAYTKCLKLLLLIQWDEFASQPAAQRGADGIRVCWIAPAYSDDLISS